MKKSSKRPLRVSRRALLFGGVGTAALLAASGGVFWWINSPHPLLALHGQSSFTAVDWSPDGRFLASGNFTSTLQVWNATNGNQVWTYRYKEDWTVNAVAWSPDGRYLAAAGYAIVQVWRTSDWQLLETYTGHHSDINAIAWSPDSQYLASVGVATDPTVHVWYATTGKRVQLYQGHGDEVDSVAWSPDGQAIVSSGRHTLQIWNVASGKVFFSLNDAIGAFGHASWSPDGQWIALAQAFVYHGHTDLVFSVSWSPDGQRLASASGDETIQIWQPG